MKRAAALALLLLHCFTLTAGATDRYVNRLTGINTGVGGVSAPWLTIAYANTHVTANDNVLIAYSATTYDAAINPSVDGTTWIGDSAMSVAAMPRVPGATISHKFTTLNGINVRGSVDLNERYCHVRKCSIMSNLMVWRGAQAIIGNRIGTDETTCQWYIQPSNPAVSGDSMYIVGNHGAMRYLGDPSVIAEPHVIHWQPNRGAGAGDQGAMKDWFVSANRCTVTMTHGQKFAKTIFTSRIRRSLFADNLWDVRDSSGVSCGNQTFVVRDSCKLLVFNRDSVYFEATDPASQSCRMFWYSSGNQLADISNSTRNCVFHSNVMPPSEASFLNEWRLGSRDSTYRNQYLCDHGGDCVKIDGAGIGSDTAFFERNTIYQHGTGRALKIESDDKCNAADAWQGHLRTLGNLCVTNSNETVYILTTPKSPGSVLSDYSMLWDPNIGRNFALKFSTCTQNPTFYKTPLASGIGQEAHGVWGSPMFADSSFATFDGNLGFGSAAIAAGPAGVDCGAFDYVSAGPSMVTDLHTAGSTSEQVTLVFTAPGAIGSAGTASSYDIRYSTSDINDGNFTSAPSFACGCSPSAAGAPEVIRVTGLAAHTTYYFAIRASNGTRDSYTSNSASETTWRANTIEP